MGCFSFMCLISDLNIQEDNVVHLFLLKNGKVIERMYGKYDSYGRVYDKNGDSFEWETDWDHVCDLMFNSNTNDGIAAILDKHYSGIIPSEQSCDDREQGCGNRIGYNKLKKEPYHHNKLSFSREEKINTILN